MIGDPAQRPASDNVKSEAPAEPPEQPVEDDDEAAGTARSELKALRVKLRAARKEAAAHEREAAEHQRAALRATAKLEREREQWAAKLARARDELDELRAAQNAAGSDERTAARATAKLEREREQWAAKRARLRAELDELRRSYHLSGVGKKLDLREVDGFSQIAAEVMAGGRTGMHYDRLYTLWQAVHAAPPGDPVIEIGTYLGGSARFIGETLQASGRTPRFYVCDTFAGHAQTEPEIDTSHHESGKFRDAEAAATAAYLEGYPALELVVGDIVQTAPRLDRESFALVHLDVDVYPTTDFCLRFFGPRLAQGALMVIDDYGYTTCPGVKRAADEFVAEFPQYRLWHLLTGQAILSRIAPSP